MSLYDDGGKPFTVGTPYFYARMMDASAWMLAFYTVNYPNEQWEIRGNTDTMCHFMPQGKNGEPRDWYLFVQRARPTTYAVGLSLRNDIAERTGKSLGLAGVASIELWLYPNNGDVMVWYCQGGRSFYERLNSHKMRPENREYYLEKVESLAQLICSILRYIPSAPITNPEKAKFLLNYIK